MDYYAAFRNSIIEEGLFYDTDQDGVNGNKQVAKRSKGVYTTTPLGFCRVLVNTDENQDSISGCVRVGDAGIYFPVFYSLRFSKLPAKNMEDLGDIKKK